MLRSRGAPRNNIYGRTFSSDEVMRAASDFLFAVAAI
jgi:hypothetical protein